jgi:hypothetical protein
VGSNPTLSAISQSSESLSIVLLSRYLLARIN